MEAVERGIREKDLSTIHDLLRRMEEIKGDIANMHVDYGEGRLVEGSREGVAAKLSFPRMGTCGTFDREFGITVTRLVMDTIVAQLRQEHDDAKHRCKCLGVIFDD